jgi:DNA-binding MarR family transcriptional regulator
MEQGLIKRIPHHTDRRAKLLVITPKGKKLTAAIELELNNEIKHLLSGISDNEAAAFQKTLETIIHNAEK